MQENFRRDGFRHSNMVHDGGIVSFRRGSVVFSLMIENIIGLNFDAVNRKILWNLNSSCRNGIRNLLFAGQVISLVYDGQKSITVNAAGDFELEIIRQGDQRSIHHISSGENTVQL